MHRWQTPPPYTRGMTKIRKTKVLDRGTDYWRRWERNFNNCVSFADGKHNFPSSSRLLDNSSASASPLRVLCQLCGEKTPACFAIRPSFANERLDRGNKLLADLGGPFSCHSRHLRFQFPLVPFVFVFAGAYS